MAWNDLPRDVKIGELIDVLTTEAVAAVNRPLANWYTNGKHQISDFTDRMRLDLEWWDRIRPLRESHSIPSAQFIQNKAESMVDYTPDQMRKALAEFYKQVSDRAFE